MYFWETVFQEVCGVCGLRFLKRCLQVLRSVLPPFFACSLIIHCPLVFFFCPSNWPRARHRLTLTELCHNYIIFFEVGMNFIVSVPNRTVVIKILKTNNKKAAITNNTPHEILKTMTNYSLKADLKTYFALSLHPHSSSGNTLCFAIIDFGT